MTVQGITMLNHRPKCHSKVVNKHNWEVKKTKLLCRFELLRSLVSTTIFVNQNNYPKRHVFLIATATISIQKILKYVNLINQTSLFRIFQAANSPGGKGSRPTFTIKGMTNPQLNSKKLSSGHAKSFSNNTRCIPKMY